MTMKMMIVIPPEEKSRRAVQTPIVTSDIKGNKWPKLEAQKQKEGQIWGGKRRRASSSSGTSRHGNSPVVLTESGTSGPE